VSATKEEIDRMNTLYEIFKQEILESRMSGDEVLTVISRLTIDIIVHSNTRGFVPAFNLYIASLGEDAAQHLAKARKTN
jgi:hypothetical protein